MRSIYKSKKRDLAKAKLEHKVAKLNNPELFENNRIGLATILVKALKDNTPRWGGLKLEFTKTGI